MESYGITPPSAVRASSNRIDIPRDVLVAALERCAWVRADVARELGVHRGTVRRNIEHYQLEEPQSAIEDRETIKIQALADVRVERLTAQCNELRAQLRNVLAERRETEDLRSAAFGLAEAVLAPPAWTLPKRKTGKHREVPVLFTSDFQWGERIDPAAVDGVNGYNIEIAQRRYRTLIAKTIDIAHHHTAHPEYDGIYYLRGGDSISGAIHDELRDTDELTPLEAVKSLTEEETAGILKLHDAFGRVHVVSVPGNHGRMTQRPRSKGYAAWNLDDMVSWNLERHFGALYQGADPPVTFLTPRSGDASFTIGNTSFLLTHGDRIGSAGGQGFIGPVATVARGIYKLRQQYHQVGKHIDWVLLGHFHTPTWLLHGVVNGSLSGFDEFAGKRLRVEPTAPSQTYLQVHPEVGITLMRHIYVDRLGGYE